MKVSPFRYSAVLCIALAVAGFCWLKWLRKPQQTRQVQSVGKVENVESMTQPSISLPQKNAPIVIERIPDSENGKKRGVEIEQLEESVVE